MAFLSVIIPSRKIYTQTMLYGVGRATDDSEFRANLRLITAILLAQWADTNPDLNGIRGHLFDMVTSEHFYTKGFAKSGEGTDKITDARLWFCTYVGFEKVTSMWAKKNHPDCHGYICMRLMNQDALHNELDSHTVQIYF